MKAEGVLQELQQKDREFRSRFHDSEARRRPILANTRRRTVELRSNDDDRDLVNASSLIYLLMLGANDPTAVPDEDYVAFATTVADVLANRGAGSEYGHKDEVKLSIDAAIYRIENAGGDATALLMAKAKYLSYIRNEAKERLAALRRAESVAIGEDLLRVRYRLTWYFIDISRYRRAIRLCESSIEEAYCGGHLKWVVGFTTNRGIARYTKLNNPDAARADFETAISMSKGLDDSLDMDIFLAESYHYLGRCSFDQGDAEGALRYYLRGRAYKARSPFEPRATASYHIRMAEVLTGAGNDRHAREHMEKASYYLKWVSDDGAASVLYRYADANMKAASGNHYEALEILRGAARDAAKCGYSRGRLLTLARMFTLNLRLKRYLRACGTLVRAVPLLFNGELRRNSLLAIIARIPTYAGHAFRPYGRSPERPTKTSTRTSPNVAPTLDCPCSMHDESSLRPGFEAPPFSA